MTKMINIICRYCAETDNFVGKNKTKYLFTVMAKKTFALNMVELITYFNFKIKKMYIMCNAGSHIEITIKTVILY